MLAAVKSRGSALQFADEKLKKDKEFILEAYNKNLEVFDYVTDSIKKEIYKDRKAMRSVIEFQCNKSLFANICKSTKNTLNFIGYYKLKALFY